MTCSWRWFIHPETAISKNRNGSSILCVFKTHYLDRRAALAKYRIFMQIQFSDHTRQAMSACSPDLECRNDRPDSAPRRPASPLRTYGRVTLCLRTHFWRTTGVVFADHSGLAGSSNVLRKNRL